MHDDTMGQAALPLLPRAPTERWVNLAILALLLLSLVIGTGEMIHGQLLRVGEVLFGDPHAGVLRGQQLAQQRAVATRLVLAIAAH